VERLEAEVALPLLDTSTSRRLVEALEAAARVGAELDRERGFIDKDGDPTGWGETLGGMALALRVEVHGPVGREA
jgi:hypothetical protein